MPIVTRIDGDVATLDCGHTFAADVLTYRGQPMGCQDCQDAANLAAGYTAEQLAAGRARYAAVQRDGDYQRASENAR